MRRYILSSAIGALALSLAACGDTDKANESAATEAGAEGGNATTEGTAVATADPNWPRGTRLVEEKGVLYRVNPDDTRVVIEDGEWRIVTEDGVRYRVNREGTRVRIDERGLDIDLDGPDIPGVDVDVGTNPKGNLDVDVSTDGNDASPER